MGQLMQSNILRSTIFQNQQPISLYSHRGHASFVLASYPKAMIDFLAGNRSKAIAFLQSEDADADRNAHTLGIDFYSGFTLKEQVRKYFYFGKYLEESISSADEKIV